MTQISTSTSEKIILGIDPGTRFLGYGLLRITNDKVTVLQYGVLNLTKYTTQGAKFLKIHERVLGIIEEFLPDEIAIESPFFGKNIQSMLKLGRVQGMIMSLAFSKSIPIAEYEPKKIKQSVTGNGNASKEQVAYMLEHLFKQRLEREFYDATDAVGVAVCHYMHGKTKALTGNNSKNKGWAAFVSENPERLK
jgi:crossover junction endodeoxyribonuclease RuvC